MARKPRAVVLDAWAVMAYLEDEPAGEKVADIIADAHENNTPLLMTVVNLGEVWYIIAREASEPEADRCEKELRQLGIEFVDADWTLTQQAARYKSQHRMSYADCFAAALAKQRKAQLATGDQEFKQIEQEIAIGWL
jgi:predicted nucleic acid-binding protein